MARWTIEQLQAAATKNPIRYAAAYQSCIQDVRKDNQSVKKYSKYRNVKTNVDNQTFDSKKEANRYSDLNLLASAGIITDLQCQVRFPLNVGDNQICVYTADFVYVQKGVEVVEDVKSPATKTRVYLLKKRLMKAIHGIDILET